jgi:hypothetical protein
MAAGFATTRAGLAAFLALSELAFAYLLGVLALGEPTSARSALGTAIVFCSVVPLALKRSPRPTAPGAPPRGLRDSGGVPVAAAATAKAVGAERVAEMAPLTRADEE